MLGHRGVSARGRRSTSGRRRRRGPRDSTRSRPRPSSHSCDLVVVVVVGDLVRRAPGTGRRPGREHVTGPRSPGAIRSCHGTHAGGEQRVGAGQQDDLADGDLAGARRAGDRDRPAPARGTPGERGEAVRDEPLALGASRRGARRRCRVRRPPRRPRGPGRRRRRRRRPARRHGTGGHGRWGARGDSRTRDGSRGTRQDWFMATPDPPLTREPPVEAAAPPPPAGRGAGAARAAAASPGRRAGRRRHRCFAGRGARAVWRGGRRWTHAKGAGESGLARMSELGFVATAGDTLIVTALAGTLFFSVSATAARDRVATSLLDHDGAVRAARAGDRAGARPDPARPPLRDGDHHAGRAFLAWVMADAVASGTRRSRSTPRPSASCSSRRRTW